MKKIGVTAKTCRSVEAALKFADEVVAGLTKSSARFEGILEVLEIPFQLRPYIKERWKHRGKPPLRVFAPYALHVLRVELFFRVALGANLIASTRPSHKIDMAYLFYLPFCMIFVSSDRLHKQCASLFLRRDQHFVWGAELKEDLAALNMHFSALPVETRQQGIYKFASRLPDESQGLIRKLFENHTPHLLKQAVSLDPGKINPAAHKKIVEDIKKWDSAPSGGFSQGGELETLIVKRSVSRTRGSWVQVGPEVPDIPRNEIG